MSYDISNERNEMNYSVRDTGIYIYIHMYMVYIYIYILYGMLLRIIPILVDFGDNYSPAYRI